MDLHFFIRRGRKLNSQLEKAIQEAMTELDRIPAPPSPSPVLAKKQTATTPITSKSTRTRITRATAAQQKTKLIKIAPAPPNNNKSTVSCTIEQQR